MRNFGLHVSVGKGFDNVVKTANLLGVTAVQIHPSAPQRWITKPIDDIKAEILVKTVKKTKSNLQMIVPHAIYLINLAQQDKQKFHLSKMSILEYLDFCHKINMYAEKYQVNLHCPGVVVHPGSAKGNLSHKQALDRVVYGLDWILEHAKQQNINANILLETSAGAGQVIGDDLSELAYLKNNAKFTNNIFYCIDTQHMWASGYNISKPNTVIEKLKKHLGITNIKLIHLNNSATELGSHKDRHANLNQGLIPEQDLKKFINNKALEKIPVVLETPACKDITTAKKEVQELKHLIGA